MHTENSREIPLQVGKFNHGREFRFVVVNVNIEIEAAGRETWKCSLDVEVSSTEVESPGMCLWQAEHRLKRKRKRVDPACKRERETNTFWK